MSCCPLLLNGGKICTSELTGGVFTIRNTNEQSDATGVTATLAYPATLIFDSYTTSQGTYDDGTKTWTIGTIPATGEVTIDFCFTVADTCDLPETITLTVVPGSPSDPDPSNDAETRTVDTLSCCDISACLTGLTSADFGNVLFVVENGDNATALKGDLHYPWAEPWTAAAAASSGDVVYVFPGDYTVGDNGSGDDFEAVDVAATGTFTLTGQPADTETINVGGKTYTFQTVLTDVDGNVLIGATASDSLDNLIAAVNLAVGAGTLYANSTTANVFVSAAAGAGDAMDVTALTAGTAGNSLATTDTIANGSWGGATLSGGVDAETRTNLFVDGVTFYFQEGAKITNNFTGPAGALFSETGAGTVSCRVLGALDVVNLATNQYVVNLDNPNVTFDFYANSINETTDHAIYIQDCDVVNGGLKYGYINTGGQHCLLLVGAPNTDTDENTGDVNFNFDKVDIIQEEYMFQIGSNDGANINVSVNQFNLEADNTIDTFNGFGRLFGSRSTLSKWTDTSVSVVANNVRAVNNTAGAVTTSLKTLENASTNPWLVSVRTSYDSTTVDNNSFHVHIDNGYGDAIVLADCAIESGSNNRMTITGNFTSDYTTLLASCNFLFAASAWDNFEIFVDGNFASINNPVIDIGSTDQQHPCAYHTFSGTYRSYANTATIAQDQGAPNLVNPIILKNANLVANSAATNSITSAAVTDMIIHHDVIANKPADANTTVVDGGMSLFLDNVISADANNLLVLGTDDLLHVDNTHNHTDAEVTIQQIATPTNTTVRDRFNTTGSSGWVSGGAISNVAAGTFDVAGGVGYVRDAVGDTDDIFSFDWSASAGLAIADGEVLAVYVDYNAGSPQVDSVDVAGLSTFPVDGKTQFLLGYVSREGTNYNFVDLRTKAVDVPALINEYTSTVGIKPRANESGLILSATGSRNLAISTGDVWEGLNSVTIPALDTSVIGNFETYHRDGGGGWTRTASQTQWNNTQWDDNSGTLQTITDEKWGIHWVYMMLDGTMSIVYGQAEYESEADAHGTQPPAVIPDKLFSEMGWLVGRVIFQVNAATDSFTVQSVYGPLFNDQPTYYGVPTKSYTPAEAGSITVDFGNLPEMIVEIDMTNITAGFTMNVSNGWTGVGAGKYKVRFHSNTANSTITLDAGDSFFNDDGTALASIVLNTIDHILVMYTTDGSNWYTEE